MSTDFTESSRTTIKSVAVCHVLINVPTVHTRQYSSMMQQWVWCSNKLRWAHQVFCFAYRHRLGMMDAVAAPVAEIQQGFPCPIFSWWCMFVFMFLCAGVSSGLHICTVCDDVALDRGAENTSKNMPLRTLTKTHICCPTFYLNVNAHEASPS